MGEENRGSSGSSTALIVVAILGGILLIGCCGGLVVMGAGAIWARTELRNMPQACPRKCEWMRLRLRQCRANRRHRREQGGRAESFPQLKGMFREMKDSNAPFQTRRKRMT
jgi:hypothetical protein